MARIKDYYTVRGEHYRFVNGVWAKLGEEKTMGLINTLTKIVPLALAAMSLAEKAFAGMKGKGAQKKEIYIESLMIALTAAEGVTGKDFVNDEEFKKLAGSVADSIISLNNYMEAQRTKKP